MDNVEKYKLYFDEVCVEDIEDIIAIGSVAKSEIYSRFKIKFEDPKLLVATWSKIYDAFLLKLKELTGKYSDFTINICDRLSIGFTTTDDEDDEKMGNFMISIMHLDCAKKNNEVDDPTAKALERAVHWNTENIISQPDLLREISIDAAALLKSINVEIASECVIPIFVTTYEALAKFLKIRRHEKDEFEYVINWASCFDIGARESQDDLDDIFIEPSINGKLTLKDDASATAKHE